MKFVLIILAATLTLPSLAQTTPIHRFRVAEKAWLDHRPDGLTFHDDSSAAVEAMNAMRRIAVEVVTNTLAKHPLTTSAELRRILASLPANTEGVDSYVLQLQPGVFAVAFNSYPSTVLFIVQVKTDNATLVWSIDNAGPQPVDTRHRLDAWLAARSGNRCQDTSAHDVRDTCGPLSASIATLPPDIQGYPRFYLSASYSKDAGILTGEQTSIWRWHDDHAELIWIAYYTGDPGEGINDIGIDFRNGILRMDQREDFKTFFANHSDSARHIRQTIRVTPNGIEDLGARSLDPELDLVDTLFDHLARNLPVERLASPDVVQQLRPKVLLIKKAAEKTVFFGMIEDWSLHHHSGNGELCLNIDDLGRYYFILQRETNGTSRIISATPADAAGPGCH